VAEKSHCNYICCILASEANYGCGGCLQIVSMVIDFDLILFLHISLHGFMADLLNDLVRPFI
jgi:hypothetical protein